MHRLDGKTVVVIGGEGLLGKIACETVRELGGTALSVDKTLGANYHFDVDVCVLAKIAEYTRCDVLVNCAIGNQKPLTHPLSRWYDDLEAGLGIAAHAMQAFSDRLKASHGVVVNIGSDLSFKAPDPDRYAPLYKPASYSVVKHGIIGLTRYYAALWGEWGVRVNCLCPGSIEQGQAVADCYMKRNARPEEMKGPLGFLMTDASSYMTGATLCVDGGSTI